MLSRRDRRDRDRLGGLRLYDELDVHACRTAVPSCAGRTVFHIFPVERGRLEQIEPQMAALSQVPEVEREHKIWSESRLTSNANLLRPGSQAEQDRWQKGYFRGLSPSGQPGPAERRSRLRLKEFAAVPKKLPFEGPAGMSAEQDRRVEDQEFDPRQIGRREHPGDVAAEQRATSHYLKLLGVSSECRGDGSLRCYVAQMPALD